MKSILYFLGGLVYTIICWFAGQRWFRSEDADNFILRHVWPTMKAELALTIIPISMVAFILVVGILTLSGCWILDWIGERHTRAEDRVYRHGLSLEDLK